MRKAILRLALLSALLAALGWLAFPAGRRPEPATGLRGELSADALATRASPLRAGDEPTLSARGARTAAGQTTEVRLESPATRVRVRVIDAVSLQPIVKATVLLDRKNAEALGDLTAVRHVELRTGPDGTASVEGLPRAVYSVHVSADLHLTMEAPAIAIAVGADRHEVEVRLPPTGRVLLRLEDGSRTGLPILAALQPRLEVQRRVVGSRAAWQAVDPTNWLSFLFDDARPTELRYDLPPGRCRVRLEDHRVEAEGAFTVRYQPVDPVAWHEVDVVAGRVLPVVLAVRCRAYVQIRGNHRDGRFDARLNLTVRTRDADTGKVTTYLPAPWQHGNRNGDRHFDGHLAPGAYEVELRRGDGRTWHERLLVERESLTRSYDAPWPAGAVR